MATNFESTASTRRFTPFRPQLFILMHKTDDACRLRRGEMGERYLLEGLDLVVARRPPDIKICVGDWPIEHSSQQLRGHIFFRPNPVETLITNQTRTINCSCNHPTITAHSSLIGNDLWAVPFSRVRLVQHEI